MTYFLLFFEFLKIGLFAVGGGLATIPFLYALSDKTGWFSSAQLVDMIALSESTPGPLGINMATFAGFQTAGILGGAVATFGLVLPALFVIIFISHFLSKFQQNAYVQSIFKGLRPAVAGMILFYGMDMLRLAFSKHVETSQMILCGCLFVLYLVAVMRLKWHPIFYILIAALVGILLQL